MGGKMIRGRAVRLRRPSFVPTVHEILPEDVPRLPGLEKSILYWTHGDISAGEWVREVRRSWGGCGLYVSRGDEVLGFSVYAPHGRLPRMYDYPFDPVSEDAVSLAFVVGDVRTGKRLVLRMLRDFKLRGVSRVQTVASDGGRAHHTSTRDLMQLGWRPVQRGLYLGRFYTVLRLELGSTVEAGEFARNLIGHVGQVRLPQLRPSAPGSLASRALDEMKLAFDAFKEADPDRHTTEKTLESRYEGHPPGTLLR